MSYRNDIHFLTIKPPLGQNDMVHLCEPYSITVTISVMKEYCLCPSNIHRSTGSQKCKVLADIWTNARDKYRY